MPMKLSAKQIQALPLLIAGLTSKAVAEEIGVSPQTLTEWRKNSEFEAYLNELKLEALNSARDQLRYSAQVAVDGLRELAHDCPNHEIRRKSCIDILNAIGMLDPETGRYSWGIESTGPRYSNRNLEQEMSDCMAKIMKDLNVPD